MHAKFQKKVLNFMKLGLIFQTKDLNRPFSKPDYESPYSSMGFIKLCPIKWVKQNFISRSMTKRSFYLRILTQKHFLRGK